MSDEVLLEENGKLYGMLTNVVAHTSQRLRTNGKPLGYSVARFSGS